MKRFVAMFVTVCLVLASIPVSYAAELQAVGRIDKKLDGCKADTPPENIFKVDGDETEFILLKTTKSPESRYFVMTKKDVGSMTFDEDKTQKFDPTDNNNIGYWLNNQFLAEGSNGVKLPKAITDNINYNHVWDTEPGNAAGNAATSYSTTCGISIISMTELLDNFKNFGIRDDMDRAKTAAWTRTPYQAGSKSDLMMVSAIDEDEVTGKTYEMSSDSKLPLRPVFYLGSDFFKKVKIQARSAGRNVKEAITDSVKTEDLLAMGYTQEEIGMLLDTSLPASEIFKVQLPATELIGGLLDPNKGAFFSVNALVGGSEQKTFNIYFSCEELGIPKTVAKFPVTPGSETTGNFSLNGLKNGEGTLNITIKDGERVCNQTSLTLRVMPKYKDQFMDQYAERSVTTNYLTPNQSNEEDTYLLNRAGVKRVKESIGWKAYESNKGSWSYSNADKLIKPLKEAGIDLINGAVASDNVYTTYAPTSSAELSDYASKYLANHFTSYGRFNQMEVWNEPNLDQNWSPTANAYSYMNVLKITALEMKKYYEDTDILATGISSTDTDYIQKLYDDKAFAYMDYVSYHPFMPASDVDQSYKNALGKMNNMLLDNGGWKEGFVTGVGWPTNTTAGGTTEDDQALQTIKSFIVADSMNTRGNSIYMFKDAGDDDRSIADRFGIVRRNASPKKAYYALSEINIALGGAIYIGELNLPGNIDAHVYMKDHKPVIALWTTQGETVSNYNFGENVEVVDLLGNKVNPVNGNTYAITRQVYYVTGAGNSWFNNCIADFYSNKLDKITQRFDGKIPSNITGGILEAKKYYNSLKGRSDFPSQSEVSDEITKLYDQGDNMIAALKNGQTSLSDKEVSTFLYMLQTAGEGLIHLYEVVTDSGDEVTSTAKADKLYDDLYYKSETNHDGTSLYSNAIFRYARRYSKKANDIKNSVENNPSKSGIILGYDRMANELLDWSDQWSQFEKVTSTSFDVEVSRDETSIFEDETKTVNFGIRSYASSPTTAVLRIYDPAGNLAKESDPIQVEENNVTMAAVPIEFSYSFEAQPGLYTYQLVSDDSQVLDSGHIIFTPKDKLDIKFEPYSGSLDSMEELTVNITNLYSEAINGTVTIEPCEGWEFANSTADISVDKGGTTTATFKVNKTSKRPFNIYMFKVKVIGSNGKTIVNSELPLSFLAIVKNTGNIDPASYHGDLSDWADAYPIFINPPKDAANINAWRASDVSGMAFIKWDDGNLYVLATVYDDRFVQLQTGSGIWSNDNIQVSLDTKNTKTKGYDGDDYEIGVAYTSKGKEAYAWTVSSTSLVPAGEWDPSMTQIIRDEKLKCTRYLLKLPARNISPLELREGTQLGLNVAINDADVSAREAMPQFTLGTADSKNPGNYKTFKMVASESAQSGDTNALPLDKQMDWVNSFASASTFTIADIKDNGYVEGNQNPSTPSTPTSMFSDIESHWAKGDIEDMASRGIVDGVGDGLFEPDRQITRAEFIALLAKAGIEKSDYKGSLSDVSSSDWYAGYVQTGIDTGVIPLEMTLGDEFKPNQPITREEMASLVVNMYRFKKGTPLESGDSLFTDEGDFAPWTVSSINAAANAGIVKGVTDGVYDAKSTATRAESVVIVKRLLSKL